MPELAPSFQRSDVKVLQKDRVYDGFFKMDRLTLNHRQFSGEWTETFSREVFERGEASAVILFDAQRDKVVLVEQFRPGVVASDTEAHSPWLLEIVAGMIEAGEEPEGVARREAQEEAGCELGNLIPISQFWVSPGGSSERIHLFCALIDSSGMKGVYGLEDEQEDILTHIISLDNAYNAIATGQINNASTIIALQWLKLNRELLPSKSSHK